MKKRYFIGLAGLAGLVVGFNHRRIRAGLNHPRVSQARTRVGSVVWRRAQNEPLVCETNLGEFELSTPKGLNDDTFLLELPADATPHWHEIAQALKTTTHDQYVMDRLPADGPPNNSFIIRPNLGDKDDSSDLTPLTRDEIADVLLVIINRHGSAE